MPTSIHISFNQLTNQYRYYNGLALMSIYIGSNLLIFKIWQKSCLTPMSFCIGYNLNKVDNSSMNSLAPIFMTEASWEISTLATLLLTLYWSEILTKLSRVSTLYCLVRNRTVKPTKIRTR